MADFMKISDCKKNKTLPKMGTPVKTVVSPTKSKFPIGVDLKYLSKRRSGIGKYYDFVAGTGGDYWWVKHDDGLAVYDNTEVFDRGE